MCDYRDENESDTDITDEEAGWGTFGSFEYGRRGLPHALAHANELVQTGGHHGAYCTCVAEAGHKMAIKMAAKCSRKYGSINITQDGMLTYVQRQTLWSAVIQRNTQQQMYQSSRQSSQPEHCSSDEDFVSETSFKLWQHLHYTDDWSSIHCARDRPPPAWGSTFLSKRVLITRTEILTLLRTKLQMEETWTNVVRLMKLHWECFGSVTMTTASGIRRKVVGISSLSPQRRDFVRLRGTENNTALSVQVMMFVKISGFIDANIIVPHFLRNPQTNNDNIVLALVRWLSPHPEASVRDSEQRPVCPPPFDINHALWIFSKRRHRRHYFSDNLFRSQLHLFPGSNDEQRRENAEKSSYTMFDFIQIQSIDKFMNCTFIDNGDSILETITLPFTVS